ncbi:Kinesin-like protein kif21a, partial [Coemansia erecta]
LYNEDLIDLLNPRTVAGSRGPAIREDSRGNMVLVGVERVAAKRQTDIIQLLHQGALSRTTASTDMNRTSSRSHAIFTIHLRQQDRRSSAMFSGDAGEHAGMDGGPTIVSKIHFVDLAGSERIKRTGAAGDRAKEGISINAGLLALGNVISALGNSSSNSDRRRALHVPYRDSKLTRLLQDSLGGNSQTLMLACISPSSKNSSESLNTIRYANRTRNIRNRVAVNFDKNSSAELSILKTEVARLRGELSKLKLQRQSTAALAGDNNAAGDTGVQRECEQLRLRNADVVKRLNSAQRRVAELEHERDALRERVNTLGGSMHPTPVLPIALLPAEEKYEANGPLQSPSTRPNSLFVESDV